MLRPINAAAVLNVMLGIALRELSLKNLRAVIDLGRKRAHAGAWYGDIGDESNSLAGVGIGVDASLAIREVF